MANRRGFVRALIVSAGTLTTAWCGLTHAVRAWANERNQIAFEAKAFADSLRGIGAANATESSDVVLESPDIAENSAIVHIVVQSKLPNTESIYVIAEKNPQPLVAQFDIMQGMDPYVALRIKMAESAFIRAVVKAGGKFYYTKKETKVTLGGCAG